MKKIISVILAAFLLLASGCSVSEVPQSTQSTQSTKSSDAAVVKTTAKAQALAQAELPSQAPYPDVSAFTGSGDRFDSKGYEAANEAYIKDVMARREAGTEYGGELDEFFAKCAAQLLAEAGEDNSICSPVNIFAAMAMLAELTDGQSRRQVLELLGVPDIETLRRLAGTLQEAIYQDDGAATVISANSVWLRNDTTYVKEALERLANDHYADSFAGEMGSEELNAALQAWLNDHTGGLLADQAAGVETDPATICALASTLYFRSKWMDEFIPDRTSQEVFHTPGGDVQHAFMHQSYNGTYFAGDNFGMVGKYFEGGDCTMWFILPDEGVTPDELLADQQLYTFLLDRGTEKWKDSKDLMIDLSVPKFDVSSDLELTEELKVLGVKDVFDPDASDFSPLTTDTDQIAVSEIKHAVRVKIDEEGCEAAAYTEMMMAGAAIPPDDRIDFTLDRPFVFAVTGTANLPLFVGVVNQP